MHPLTQEEGQLALRAARTYAESAVTEDAGTPAPSFPPVFDELRGVFVTLNTNGRLRGCIGYPYPVLPLKDAIRDAAVHACLNDPRFPAVTPEELGAISIEVTILSRPEPLECPPEERQNHIKIGTHGIIARIGARSGLLLPQVAVEFGWNTEEFLSQTCIKAGLNPDAWHSAECSIQLFEGQIFCEEQ
ncbi:MAG: TIGR00296 family protein [Methanocorpusculum sp.]|nr:TIGR00296 family protein [Methanocorpusculum sp.]